MDDLGRQSLRRALTADETALARSLEVVFATGDHDFASVVAYLSDHGVARPSGSSEPWTTAALHDELVAINTALDHAYAGRAPQRGAVNDG